MHIHMVSCRLTYTVHLIIYIHTHPQTSPDTTSHDVAAQFLIVQAMRATKTPATKTGKKTCQPFEPLKGTTVFDYRFRSGSNIVFSQHQMVRTDLPIYLFAIIYLSTCV